MKAATTATAGPVGVMGAGSIGCYLGGLLATQGHRVVLLGRPRVMDELSRHGLALEDLDGGRARVMPGEGLLDTTSDPTRLRSCEVILVTVKSAQTESAARELSPLLRPDAVLISLQNGVRNPDVLREQLPRHTVLAGIVGFNVVGGTGDEKGRDGTYRRTTTGPLVIEASPDPRVSAVVDALSRAGLPASLSSEVRAQQWSKLIMNLNNAVSALSGKPTPVLLFDPAYRRILRAIMKEALFVMRRAGIRLARFGALPARVFPHLLALPTPLLRIALRAQLRVDPGARSSMWEDIERGRPTEVDVLNGEIVRLAQRAGIDAPLNRRVVAAVHEAEARGPGSPQLGPDELAEALGLFRTRR